MPVIRPFAPSMPVHRSSQAELDAARPMLVLVEIRDLRRRDPGQHPVERLDHHHLLAERAENRRCFEADIAAADDRDPADRVQLGL